MKFKLRVTKLQKRTITGILGMIGLFLFGRMILNTYNIVLILCFLGLIVVDWFVAVKD